MSFPDGTVYHPRTAMLSRCRAAVQVPKKPTEANARAALADVRRYFDTVACADAERIIDADGIERTNLDLPPGVENAP
jgi:hypothetical protein